MATVSAQERLGAPSGMVHIEMGNAAHIQGFVR